MCPDVISVFGRVDNGTEDFVLYRFGDICLPDGILFSWVYVRTAGFIG